MNIPFLDLKGQYAALKPEIDQAVQNVLADVAFVGGPYVEAFENAFADFCGATHCIGVGNGTDALAVTLKAIGIGPGDEVIVPANTFIATSEAVTLAGARVAFVDIDPKTYTIDPARIESKITPRTRAIIPVHLYGQPADMDPILDIAATHRLFVIEDAAQAHGASYKGRMIGSIGDAACFSFYPGKNLGAYGDGGAIVTSDDTLAAKARLLINHGRVDQYNHAIEGLNSRLDGLQAAILQVKLKHLPEWTTMRRRRARLYSELLANADIVAPPDVPGTCAVYHLYVVRVGSDMRNALRAFLQQHNISTGVHYPIALPNLPAYAYLNHRPAGYPEATRASGEILSLPIYPELKEADVAYVCETVARFQANSVALQANTA